MSDLYDQVQDIDNRMGELETNPIPTDMNFDTMTNLTNFLQGNFWYFGQATLSSGSAILNLSNAQNTSLVFVTGTTNLGSGTSLAGSCNAGVLTITSSSGTDTRVVNYWVII